MSGSAHHALARRTVKASGRGFTLIELLVVVSIIALLIAILLPSLSRAKAQAKRVQCASVLKQWGVVVNMYAQENSNQIFLRTVNSAGTNAEWYVAGSTSTPGSPYNVEWNNFNFKMRTCPADDPGVTGPDYRFTRFVPKVSNKTAWNLSEFSHPIDTMLMCDADSNSNVLNYGGVSAVSDELLNPAKNINVQQDLDRRHMGTGNVLFLGGHVEAHNWQDYVDNIPDKSDLSGPGDHQKRWTQLTVN